MLVRPLAAVVLILVASFACDRAASQTTAPQSASSAAPATPLPTNHVLVISVDGLRADMLEPPMITEFPALTRLLRGPHTLNARTDPDFTVTLPNHISMVTGRATLGEAGHGWTLNTDPAGVDQGGTMHATKGAYVASMFDVAHDAGVATGVFVSKTKFWVFTQSYGDKFGAPDIVEPDEGTAKIDLFVHADSMSDLGGTVADHLRRKHGKTLDFVHFAAPDIAGHSYDWKVNNTSKYFEAVVEVDHAIAEILRAIDETEHLRGTTAIILTADHGGGVPLKTHTDMTCPLNFRIPFLVWMGDASAALDLQALNPARTKPARDELITRVADKQPIRNGDAANAALHLLGLPSVPGSRYGADEPLHFAPPTSSDKTKN